MDWTRMYRHFAAAHRGARELFTEETMQRLQQAIATGEATHRGEVRLIVESALPLRKVRRGMSARQRALDLFGTFRVWDTEENNGVLLYINVADRKIEVIADRAAARRIGDPHWKTICGLAQQAFREGRYERGVNDAVDSIHRALAVAFPADPLEPRRNELSDEPVVL
jgi:uncharacterized membrane protein